MINEDVDTIDTGFGTRKPTLEERIEILEKEVRRGVKKTS